jgi:hypothetical protein
MKRLILCACAYLVLIASSFKTVSADETIATNSETFLESYISTLYSQINFIKSERLSYEVFAKAYKGYLNLRNAGKLNTDKNILTICNFSLPSTEQRMWIIDLDKKKVLINTYVAHGQGSGEDCDLSFSNEENSHKSSLGFYVTGEVYNGDHGTSLRLDGMDMGFNDAARDRSIVVHGSAYVCKKFVATHQRAGRSWGCPAVPAKLSLPVIKAINDRTCLFIYYPDAHYLQASYWLNKKVTHLPENIGYSNMIQPEMNGVRLDTLK